MPPGREGNRRGFIRIPFTTHVEIETEKQTIQSSKAVNISLSGLYVSGIDTVPGIGASCRVSILLEGAEKITIKAGGRISRSEPGSVAVHFTELDLDSYHHLRQLILYNADDPEKAEQEFVAHWGIKPRAF